MAQQEEEIIIIEEEEAAGFETFHNDDLEENITPTSNKTYILMGAIFGFVFLILIIFLLMDTQEPRPYEKEILLDEEQTTQEDQHRYTPSQLEQMIQRANILYTHDNKDAALKLYQKIATYSESISYYNLGVAQLQNKQYQKAIENFDKAIANNQHLCVSAINAAVASLELGNKEQFQDYMNKAHAYLPQEASSPMYSYYYALINFYQENYLEALSPLKYRTSEDYAKIQDQLHAKINLLFSSYHQSISDLEKASPDDSALSLGLLYANLGDLTLAKKYLRMAIQQGLSPVKSQLALGYVNLKAGQVQDASKLLENITTMYPQDVYKHYPIETYLKESLFDINLAQKNFHDNIIHNPSSIYQILFYFAPYKIFNANQTISYIRKGNANVSIDNITGASQYLSQSASLSNVNAILAESIQDALHFRLYEANTNLQDIAKQYPRHSIIQYNLALTYAQLGKISLAHKHFIKSYHLDAKNYLSGIFSIMTSKLLNKNHEKLAQILKDNLSLEPKNDEFNLYRTLLHYKEGNLVATYQWMDSNKKEKPFNLVLDTLIAMSLGRDAQAQEFSNKLIKLLPNDILPHLLYIDTHFSELEQKMFAREAIRHLKRQNFSMNDYYYGPFISKYLYTQYAQFTGSLRPLQEQLKQKMNLEKEQHIGVMQALALVNLYVQEFEESYTIYNELIDTHKQQDSHTLFLAAIASTGASHPANAIALLELARRKNPEHKESRYALGLLYLQTQNNKGAIISFKNMGELDFQSQYFNFRIAQ